MPRSIPSTERIGLIVALPAEARSVGVHGVPIGKCVRWKHGCVAISGVGFENATQAAQRLVACGVGTLANWGVAGALAPGLEPGDVVIPERICHVEGEAGYATDPTACRHLVDMLAATNLRIDRGKLWSAPQPVATCAEKHDLAARTGAVAVDMEAAAIAIVAAHSHLPFIAVKAICDSAARELPPRVVEAMEGAEDGFSWRMLAAIVFGGAATWRAARELAHDFACARRSLATAAALAA